MQIIENQTIFENNLIDYNSKIKKKYILELVKFISNHLYVLGLEKNGNIIFSLISEDKEDAEYEILIPVNGVVTKCSEYSYKPMFSLKNAISIRHEGSLSDLKEATLKLEEYILSNNYLPATKTYYIVIREGDSNAENCIIDIYIGINDK